MATKTRKTLTLSQKLEILRDLENGASNSAICKSYNLSKSTVSTILKNKDNIRSARCSNISKLKRIRKSQRPDVDQALLKWFSIQRSQNMPLTGSILQTKAEELAKLCPGNENFVCSKGWIDRFKSRHNITAGKVHGEAASVSMESVTNWLTSTWPEISRGYSEDDIFNGDETGLFFKMTPDKTLKFKGEKCSGGKQSKERITVWVCANMSGKEKRRLLIIGKSKSPRCFKNCSSLPVDYRANKKAWVTGEIFETLLRDWDHELAKTKRRILLIVDNCPAHPQPENLKFIKLVFLPPNVTAVLQPMDQGVIRCLKSYYRKMFIVRLITAMEMKEDFKFTVLDAIQMISAAWRRISQTTIQNCFRHAGFSQNSEFEEEDNLPLAQWRLLSAAVNQNDEDDMPLSTWLTRNNITAFSAEAIDTYVTIDDDVITNEVPSDADLVAAVVNDSENNEDIVIGSSDDENDNVNQEIEIPTASKVLSSMGVVFTFMHSHNADDSIIASYDKIYKFIESQALLQNKTQNKITDYFSQT